MKRRADTLLVTAGRDPRASFDFVNPPLVRGSTVLHESVADMKARIASRNAGADLPVTYGIYGTPTHHAFYEALNALESGHASWALPSGLTACTVPILAFVQQGDHVRATASRRRSTTRASASRDARRSRRCSARRRVCCFSNRQAR
jgi:cysteine-S-conjugate beta-lyase